MQKSKEKKEKPGKSRSKKKYPNLEKSENLKGRRDYIETDYINGVSNSLGETVIRALTADEKSWLDTFYSEYVNASVSADSLHSILDKEDRVALKEKIAAKKLTASKLQSQINLLTQCIELLQNKKDVLGIDILELKKEDGSGRIYDGNNDRNRCLYNQTSKTNKLVELDRPKYSELNQELKTISNTNSTIVNDKDLK